MRNAAAARSARERPAVVGRGEQRVVAALQVFHHVGPLAPELEQGASRGQARPAGPSRRKQHRSSVMLRVVATSAENLPTSSSTTNSSPRSSGLSQACMRRQVSIVVLGEQRRRDAAGDPLGADADRTECRRRWRRGSDRPERRSSGHATPKARFRARAPEIRGRGRERARRPARSSSRPSGMKRSPQASTCGASAASSGRMCPVDDKTGGKDQDSRRRAGRGWCRCSTRPSSMAAARGAHRGDQRKILVPRAAQHRVARRRNRAVGDVLDDRPALRDGSAG